MDVLLVTLGPLVFLLAVLAMMRAPDGYSGHYYSYDIVDLEDGDE